MITVICTNFLKTIVLILVVIVTTIQSMCLFYSAVFYSFYAYVSSIVVIGMERWNSGLSLNSSCGYCVDFHTHTLQKIWIYLLFSID